MGAGKALAVAGLALGLGCVGCNQLVGSNEVSTDGADKTAVAEPAQGTPTPGGELNCLYQPSDPGVTAGKFLPASFSWQGFIDAAQDPTTIHATDFYDCNGGKGVDAAVYEIAKFG